jgi:hypothetical protein
VIGFFLLPVILFGLFLASAENAAPGVVSATTLAMAEIYAEPNLPGNLAALVATKESEEETQQ